MSKYSYLILLNCLYVLTTYSQSSIELIPAAGNTFSDNINYQGCTGHIDPAFQFSSSFIYHPNHVFGLELTYTVENPTTYLNDPGNASVKAYTSSSGKCSKAINRIKYIGADQKILSFYGLSFGVYKYNYYKSLRYE